MSYYVYILYSELLKRYYTGFSKFTKKRLYQHRKRQNDWTSRASDWKEVFSIKVESTSEARMFERKIKKRGAARFLADIAPYQKES